MGVANLRLLVDERAIDCDKLMAKLDLSMWLEDWHLTTSGYAALGESLAKALAVYVPSLGLQAPPSSSSELSILSDFISVNGGHIASLSNITTGVYVSTGTHHGKPQYMKRDCADHGNILLFFCDERYGAQWAGWWFGPETHWGYPGWAHHDSTTASTPPDAGWRV